MRKIIIATHDHLAEAYVGVIKMIAGSETASRIKPFCMTEGKTPEEMSDEIKSCIKEDDSYLVFADLYGASPCNSCLMGFRKTNYRILTGFNLGMVLEALYAPEDESIDSLANRLVETGKEGIRKVYLDM